MQRPTKRARFMRGVVAPIFGLLAALSIVLGVLNATVWKPSSIVSAHANVYGSRYIVTDPGVLNLVDYRVKISVAALNSRKPICVAVGLAKDVRGWTKGYSVQRITGLNNWNSLSTDVMNADDNARVDSAKTDDSKVSKNVSKDASKDVDFKDSDLWTNATCQMGLAKLFVNAADFEQVGNAADLALKQESQEGLQAKNNVQSDAQNGAQSQTSHQKLSSELQSKIARRVLIIDLGKNSPEAFVELRWRRHNLPDFATPMYFVGALFILLCGLSASVFAMAPHRRRNKRLVASRTGLISVENNSQEEVKFSEALAGTIAGIFGSNKDKKSKHKVGSGAHARHGVHARTRTTKSQAAVDSSISVKSGLNSSKTAALDETTVISKDDLQAYFARLASESSSDFKGDFAAENNAARNNASENNAAESFDLSSANQSEQSKDLHESAESSESRNSGIAGKSGKSQKSQGASKSEDGFAKKRYKKESYKDRKDRNDRKENSAGGSKKANRGERKNRDGIMDAEFRKDDDNRKRDNRIGENLGKSLEAGDSSSAKPGEARRKSRNQFNQRDYRSQNRGKSRKYKGSENRTSGYASGGNTNGNKDGNKASNNANHDANGFNNAGHQNASRQNGSQNGSSKPSKNRKK
ncbi:hypothetical protein CG392_04240 [Gardnerella vaginalis]|uniref:Uncharacterized protein n=1 Tax=Gardnerella piotii TaxID=2792977 RepID=A0ABU5MPA1_9BIFI|nr:hypothetical protein [Gardnerella piotii]MDZ7544243.1 hypothetical protein [Gardnerella piotii]MDZ7552388.1 hypothetical protein [Gardnerella piotii]RFT26048.1 hypothetical protein CG392_04240 [Gardnerella vaginalis]